MVVRGIFESVIFQSLRSSPQFLDWTVHFAVVVRFTEFSVPNYMHVRIDPLETGRRFPRTPTHQLAHALWTNWSSNTLGLLRCDSSAWIEMPLFTRIKWHEVWVVLVAFSAMPPGRPPATRISITILIALSERGGIRKIRARSISFEVSLTHHTVRAALEGVASVISRSFSVDQHSESDDSKDQCRSHGFSSLDWTNLKPTPDFLDFVPSVSPFPFQLFWDSLGQRIFPFFKGLNKRTSFRPTHVLHVEVTSSGHCAIFLSFLFR